ncbi:aspartate aminotransferase family protein [Natronococcus wangiae]|uniref:aspartate aminotransferase family protein n=1 Tax=Natronococcus wangiae TaxID=3068275 RepID=UPI00273F61D8|nr:aspartate aminotransferase family protein [Natronococcus sp. AD5]
MSTDEGRTNLELLSEYDEYVMPVWKELSIPIKSASDCVLEDFDGEEYLDAFSGISVTNAGHHNDAIVEAATEQLRDVVHTCSYLHPNEPVAKLGKKIAEITPGDLQRSFFCNSGTEAVEGAVKLARKYTGSKEVVALEMAFHGRTLGSLALTGNSGYKRGMAPTLNDVAHARAPYAYRCSTCDGGPCPGTCADELETVITAHTSDDLAAVIVEPVMGEAGIVVPPEGWLERVRELAHEHDAVLIADEVQSGYGRTGELWAVDHFDVVPDIMCQAKGIANGLPLGAFTATPEVADAFDSGDHYSTFGGNPVACAAACATIDQLQDGILDNAGEQGAWLADELATLADEYNVVGDARGLGLMHGLEIVDPDAAGPRDVSPAPDPALARTIASRLVDAGIVIGVGGFYKSTLRIQPPLTIEREQLEAIVTGLREALEAETAG